MQSIHPSAAVLKRSAVLAFLRHQAAAAAQHEQRGLVSRITNRRRPNITTGSTSTVSGAVAAVQSHRLSRPSVPLEVRFFIPCPAVNEEVAMEDA